MTKNNFESCIALTCTQKHQDKPATILRNIIQEPQKLFIIKFSVWILNQFVATVNIIRKNC